MTCSSFLFRTFRLLLAAIGLTTRTGCVIPVSSKAPYDRYVGPQQTLHRPCQLHEPPKYGNNITDHYYGLTPLNRDTPVVTAPLLQPGTPLKILAVNSYHTDSRGR